MKCGSVREEEKKKGVKDLNFSKGILVGLLGGLMRGCLSMGLGLGESLCLGESGEVYKSLGGSVMVSGGGLVRKMV